MHKIYNCLNGDFRAGFQNGLPIGMGYLAVSFSVGIAAHNAGLTIFQSLLSSIVCNASAGQYAAYTLIAASAPYLEVALMVFIANARYMLMSCAMSQRIAPSIGLWHRLAMSFSITDELFALNIVRPGYLSPMYNYGAALASLPFWALGTALGALCGNILPARLVSALSVALYGMFLAVIIPPTRSSRILSGLVAVSAVMSFVLTYLPNLAQISAGTRTILLTLLISAGAAVLFPVKEEVCNP